MQGDANDNSSKNTTKNTRENTTENTNCAPLNEGKSGDILIGSSANSETIKKLLLSFRELEEAINKAKVTLAKKEFVPAHVIIRLNSYDGILSQQRDLANKLCAHMDNGNWNEVTRHVSLINGLSAMIRDDAGAILNTLSASSGLGSDSNDKEDTEINYC